MKYYYRYCERIQGDERGRWPRGDETIILFDTRSACRLSTSRECDFVLAAANFRDI